MIKVALKGLAGRKVRALLTALAVVIGVSMVSGTFVLTDTMQKAFDGIFEESYEGTDAVVNGKQLVEFSTGGRATVPASLLEGHRGPPRRRRGRGFPAGPAEQLQPRQAARQQGRDHRPRGPDDGRRHRRGRPPVLPAQAQAGRLGGRRRRDRPRRRHGEQAGLRGRRHDQGRRHRPGPAVQDHGHRHLRVGRLAGQRLARHLPPPDGAGPVRQGRRLRQHLGEGRRGHLPGAAGARRSSRCCPRPPTSRPATPRRPPTPRTSTRA